MHIYFLSSSSGPQGGHALHGTVSGPVDGISVDTHPVADSTETLLEFRLNEAIGLWTHIEQKVTAAACYFHQGANKRLRRFEIPIVYVVSPRVIDGHARFPQLKVLGLGNCRLQLLLNAGVNCIKANILGRDPRGNKLFWCFEVSRDTNASFTRVEGCNWCIRLMKRTPPYFSW